MNADSKDSYKIQNDSGSDSLSRKFTLRNVLILLSVLAAAKLAVVLLIYYLPPTVVMPFPDIFPFPSSFGWSSLSQVLTNTWDGMDYQMIARSGYPQWLTYSPELYAFSPVYPALIVVGRYLTGNPYESAFFVTNLFSFAFPIVVFKSFDFRTALVAELFPTYLVFTTVGYSDAIALFFLALSFLCFYKNRRLFAGLAISASGFVLFNLLSAVVPFVVYMFLFQKNRKWKNYLAISLPAVVAGLSILGAYQVTTGSPFTFFVLEQHFWSVQFASPLDQVEWLFKVYAQGSFNGSFWVIFGLRITSIYWLVRNLLFEAFLFIGIALLTRIKDSRKWLLVLYSVTLSVPLLFVEGTPVYSIPRLMLAAFPFFTGYSGILTKNWRLWIYAIACIVASFWVIITFVYAFFA